MFRNIHKRSIFLTSLFLKNKKMTSRFHTGLLRDFLMLKDADDHNVVIQVGENQDQKEFRAHSIILKARSPYFKNAFSTGSIAKKDNMMLFKKPNINPTVFEMILKYVLRNFLIFVKKSFFEYY